MISPSLSTPTPPLTPKLHPQIQAQLILSPSHNSLLRTLLSLSLPLTSLLTYSELSLHHSFSPDRFTFPSLLKACSLSSSFSAGRALHGQLLKLGFNGDPYVQSTLITFYSSCRDVDSAMQVFRQSNQIKNKVIWSSIINGLVKNHLPDEALTLFFDMEAARVGADDVTLTGAVAACAALGDLDMAVKLSDVVSRERKKRVFDGMPERRSFLVLDSAVVDMYVKCGALERAREVFEEMPERNVVTWSAMISGLAQHGHAEEGLALFRRMLGEGVVVPNAVTLSAALSACAQAGDLGSGMWIHAYILRSKMEFPTSLHNSLVDMYSKCGFVDAARRTFEETPDKDVVSWNVIIGGLAMNGLAELALEKFDRMQREGVRPDEITFIGVLSACSHGGLVEKGWAHYRSMEEVYGIRPKNEHNGCVVDMMSRAGRVKEAEEFVRKMEGETSGEILGALLSGCASVGEVGKGEEAARRLLEEVEPDDDGGYVVYSNMLERKGRREEGKRVREIMEERGIRKVPGCSTIDVDGILFEFFSGESSDNPSFSARISSCELEFYR